MAFLCSYFIVISIANLLKSKYLFSFFKHHPSPVIILAFMLHNTFLLHC